MSQLAVGISWRLLLLIIFCLQEETLQSVGIVMSFVFYNWVLTRSNEMIYQWGKAENLWNNILFFFNCSKIYDLTIYVDRCLGCFRIEYLADPFKRSQLERLETSPWLANYFLFRRMRFNIFPKKWMISEIATWWKSHTYSKLIIMINPMRQRHAAAAVPTSPELKALSWCLNTPPN